jgi:hypothetical protein
MIEIKEDAVLDDNQKKVIAGIEPFTEGVTLKVTRGHSSPEEQLAIIAHFAVEHDIHFPEFIPGDPVDAKKEVPGLGLVYHWQRTWSRELHLGLTVNPPRSATCLDDYTRPTGEYMKGKTIQASTHIVGERDGEFPIDFSSRVNGIPNIEEVAKILEAAKKAQEEAEKREAAEKAGIEFIRIEHGNGCVHIGTKRVI